jgi:hypothetical protein
MTFIGIVLTLCLLSSLLAAVLVVTAVILGGRARQFEEEGEWWKE